MPEQQSPYPLGTLVRDPRLLNNRRPEILAALDAVAPTTGAQRHVLIHGEARSGRSSVLAEVARRAVEDRKRVVLWLRGDETRCRRQSVGRHVLTAIVEELRASIGAESDPWYQAWRNRAYLRDRSPASSADLLSSALVLAADPDAELDPAIVHHDLKALLSLCRKADLRGIVIVIDDASTMTEDVALLEELIAQLDAVGDAGLLMAGLPASARHFVEAASPCLTRIRPVRLRPFFGLFPVYTSLSGPVEDDDRRWVRAEDVALLRDVLRLTGGNPYELMLVGHHMWLACKAGEQERYQLTPRVLDSVIPTLALHASTGDALLDGARAIERLADERVRRAVELVARSELTIRQVAIAEILKVDSRDSDQVDSRLLTADVDGECARVRTEIEELEDVGVMQLHDDQEHFTIVGGPAAAVLLKYKARSRIGAEVSRQPFDMNFLATVGRALARDAAVKARTILRDSESLGFSVLVSEDGAGRHSPRAAIRALSGNGGVARLAQAEIDLIPAKSFDRIGELLGTDELTLAVVSISVVDETQELEYTEVWELSAGTTEKAVGDAWSTIAEQWQPIVAAADLRWNGIECAVLEGRDARLALIAVQHYASTVAVHELFVGYEEHGDENALALAVRATEEAVTVLEATGLSDRELDGELSAMYSRLGFLRGFDKRQLGAAREASETALRAGEADGWVTRWNLANILARQGELALAREQFDAVTEASRGWGSTASVTLYVPGRAAKDSMLKIGEAGLPHLLELQAALYKDQPDPAQMTALAESCRDSDDPGLAAAAAWVIETYSERQRLPSRA